MPGRFPLTARFLGLCVIPLALAVGAAAWHFRAALPEHEALARVKGVLAPIRVERDAWGVPSIMARTEHDVYFAMGYVHAQDRLWQMEVQRRFAQGRLSEIFGRRTLQQDVWMRTLSLSASAQSAWAVLSPAARDALQAYAGGVNSWLTAQRALPPEFALLGVSPEPWTPIDSLSWMKVFALNLAGNMNRETSQYMAAEALTPGQLSTFFPNGDRPPERPAQASLPELRQQMIMLSRVQQALHNDVLLGGPFVGSNAWVAGRQLTGGQGALLANDPHLGLQIPSPWYPVRQQGGSLVADGMSLVGLPLIVFGKNRHIAWGGTNMMADTQDLYLEQAHPANPRLYRAGAHWHRMSERTETIAVRADFPASLRRAIKPVTLVVRATRHGPVVSDAVGLPGQPIALRWTSLDPGDTTFEAMLELNHARDWPGFKRALRKFVGPTLNMLYADRQGNIGYLGIGKVPVRAHGIGKLPQAAHLQAEWTGDIAPHAMPHAYNPPQGCIVSANNKMMSERYRHFISNDWASPARANRIDQLIRMAAAKGPLTAADFKRMQADTVSLPARRLLALARRLKPGTSSRAAALAYLSAWNGDMGAQGPAPPIFSAWSVQLKRTLFGRAFQADWRVRGRQPQYDALVNNASIDELIDALGSPKSAWCRNAPVFRESQCAQLMLTALDDALSQLNKVAGSEMASWRWDQLHYAYLAHQPFSQVNFLKNMFEWRGPGGGSPDTVNVANGVPDPDGRMRQTFGPSFRQIITMRNDSTELLFMNSAGQSGNPLSAHYADMSPSFSAVRYRVLGNPALTRLLIEPMQPGSRGEP